MAITTVQKGETKVQGEGRIVRINLMGPTWNDGYDHCIQAEVWNPETRRVERVTYATTMDTAEYHGSALVDATPEVLAAAEARRAYDYSLYACREAEERATRPSKGHVARVVRGRKVPKGTQGVIFWYGDCTWGPRIGLKTTPDAEPTWVALSNCEIVVPEEFTAEIASRRAEAEATFNAAVPVTINHEEAAPVAA